MGIIENIKNLSVKVTPSVFNTKFINHSKSISYESFIINFITFFFL